MKEMIGLHMNDSAKRRPALAKGLVTTLLAASLAGCATQSPAPQDRLGSFMVTPGKYNMYNCAQLEAPRSGMESRKRELDALIAKAGAGPGGAVAATLAYRTEYAQVQGELAELAKESAAKNCPPPKPAAAPSPTKPKKTKPARG
jgi:hypothetical protein